MKRSRVLAVAVGCFVLGVLVHSALAQAKKPSFTPDLIQGKEPNAAATALLDGALQLAGDGSWERIAVGRAWYLGGDKAKGQQILDGVTGGKKVVASDWWRIGRLYTESNEWDKAQQAFEKALSMNQGDDTGMVEYGAYLNLHKDRAKAEEWFLKAFKKNPKEFWHWVNAGGSYLGVKPNL